MQPGEWVSPEAENGLQTQEIGLLGFPVQTPAIERWEGRYSFVRACINMGLNGPQIAKLSLSTPQPLKTHQQVYDYIESANLVRLFTSPRIRRRRVGPHNEGMVEVFTKVCGQALEHRYEVREIMRDEAPEPGCRFRTDVGLTIGGEKAGGRWFPFYFEYQSSPLEYTRWHAKLRNYIRLYEMIERPFRSCFILQNSEDVTSVRYTARKLLERDHPTLNLFYFITLGEFRRHWDLVRQEVWVPAWKWDKQFALMPTPAVV